MIASRPAWLCPARNAHSPRVRGRCIRGRGAAVVVLPARRALGSPLGPQIDCPASRCLWSSHPGFIYLTAAPKPVTHLLLQHAVVTVLSLLVTAVSLSPCPTYTLNCPAATCALGTAQCVLSAVSGLHGGSWNAASGNKGGGEGTTTQKGPFVFENSSKRGLEGSSLSRELPW